MNSALRAWYLLRHLGPGWITFRLQQALRQRTGYYEKHLPVAAWADRPLQQFLALDKRALAEPAAYLKYRRSASPKFFFAPEQREAFAKILLSFDASEAAKASPVTRADRLLAGEFSYFEFHTARAGFPPQWHRNAFSGEEAACDRHWSRISDFGSGDIKLIWEPSRFGWAYLLVRAYWRTGDNKYAEAFWQLIEDWQQRNPPNTGANWKCGQETSLRVMACCFGLYGLLNAPATTPERVANLARMIAVSGERVAGHIDYALSQRNNHGVSEALGLFTIGVLFPEFSDAAGWRETGRRYLEQLGRDLIYEDGSFSQHSANYQRLMLHDYLWALRLGELNGVEFSGELKQRVQKSADFLFQVQDEQTGQTPTFGPNDGALILPLNNCPPEDYRPVTQALHHLGARRHLHGPGPWNEDLLWFFGAEALKAPAANVERSDFAATAGGWWTLRAKEGFAFMHAAKYHDRPAHADALHADIWWRGRNVAIDPGTFSYNAPAPWNDPLAHTPYHNTVSVDGRDQMVRAGKFLWLPWMRASGGFHSAPVVGPYWEGEHSAYPGVQHRRAVLRGPAESFIIVDRLLAAKRHAYRLHWLLPKAPHDWNKTDELVLHFENDHSDFHVKAGSTAPMEPSLVIADPNSPRGWRAPHYYQREPAISLAFAGEGETIWFYTLFSSQKAAASFDGSALKIEMAGETILLSLAQSPEAPSIISAVERA